MRPYLASQKPVNPSIPISRHIVIACCYTSYRRSCAPSRRAAVVIMLPISPDSAAQENR